MSENARLWYESMFYRTKYLVKPRAVADAKRRFAEFNAKHRQVSWRFTQQKMDEYIDWLGEVQGKSFEAVRDDESPETWEIHVDDNDFWTCGEELVKCLFTVKQANWKVKLAVAGIPQEEQGDTK